MPHIDTLTTKLYVNKVRNARNSGHEFDLSYPAFKRMRMRKTCTLSGVKMNLGNSTIDRVDNQQGYLPHNAVGVRNDVNQLKGTIERLIADTPDINWKTIKKMVDNTIKYMEK